MRYNKRPDLNLSPQSTICSYAPACCVLQMQKYVSSSIECLTKVSKEAKRNLQHLDADLII